MSYMADLLAYDTTSLATSSATHAHPAVPTCFTPQLCQARRWTVQELPAACCPWPPTAVASPPASGGVSGPDDQQRGAGGNCSSFLLVMHAAANINSPMPSLSGIEPDTESLTVDWRWVWVQPLAFSEKVAITFGVSCRRPSPMCAEWKAQLVEQALSVDLEPVWEAVEWTAGQWVAKLPPSLAQTRLRATKQLTAPPSVVVTVPDARMTISAHPHNLRGVLLWLLPNVVHANECYGVNPYNSADRPRILYAPTAPPGYPSWFSTNLDRVPEAIPAPTAVLERVLVKSAGDMSAMHCAGGYRTCCCSVLLPATVKLSDCCWSCSSWRSNTYRKATARIRKQLQNAPSTATVSNHVGGQCRCGELTALHFSHQT